MANYCHCVGVNGQPCPNCPALRGNLEAENARLRRELEQTRLRIENERLRRELDRLPPTAQSWPRIGDVFCQ